MALARRLAGCVAVSASLHALALQGLAPAPSIKPFADAKTTPRGLHIRLQGEPAPPAPPIPQVPPPDSAPDASAIRPAQVPQPAAPAQGGVAEILPAPHYFPASELDRRPEPIGNIVLVYPENAPDDIAESRLRLRLLINESGGVDTVLVASAELPGVFEESAIKAFRGARFSPGIRNGVAVKSQKLVEISYGVATPRAALSDRQRAAEAVSAAEAAEAAKAAALEAPPPAGEAAAETRGKR